MASSPAAQHEAAAPYKIGWHEGIEAEFALLEERARGAGMRLGQWVREALLSAPAESQQSGPDSGEVALAEALALRSLLLNLTSIRRRARTRTWTWWSGAGCSLTLGLGGGASPSVQRTKALYFHLAECPVIGSTKRYASRAGTAVGLLAVLGLGISMYITDWQAKTLPGSPVPATGNTYRMSIHGLVIYQTIEELRTLNWIENISASMAAVSVVLLLYGRLGSK